MMEREFLQHCMVNNLERVNDCLSRGVDVNTQNSNGLTGLMIACNCRNPAIVSRLVQVPGLDINYQDEDGFTAAHRASERGQTEYVRILAETGRVDWNKADKWGTTPLYWALKEGHSDIVDFIVQQPNIDYNIKTNIGETLGHTAVRGGEKEAAVSWRGGKCLETLAAQERCECWNIPDRSYGDTPIMRALKRGKTEIVEILLRCPRVDLSCRDREGWSLVFRAIQRNKLGEQMSSWDFLFYNLCC